MFYTATFDEWMEGFKHPFLAFFGSLDIYHGGLPSVAPFYAIKADYKYAENLPKHIIRTGKGNTDKTGHYVEYFGSTNADWYGPVYNQYSPNAKAWRRDKLWNDVDGPVVIKGGPGSKFKSGLGKSDEVTAYSTALLRYFDLYYDETTHHHDLEVYKMDIKEDELANRVKNPDMAKWW
jgi:hypothetical protein